MILVPSQERDFVEWHGGCPTALVWAIDLRDPALAAQVAAARARLGDVLLPRYERHPHVTIAYAGLAPHEGATPEGHLYPQESLARDLDLLRGSGIGPLRVDVSGWDTFAMAPYLGAQVPGAADLRALLLGGAEGYVPHVTLGFFAAGADAATLHERMEGWDAPSLHYDVDALTLFGYATADIAGPLTVVGRLSLADGTWTPAT